MLSLAEVERYFENEPPALLEIILELRNLIFAVAPHANEMIQWKGISYFDADRGGTVSAGICQIHIKEGCVRLGFIHGAFLPDPDHLLEGEGKAKRFVRVCSYETAPWESLKRLIEAAIRVRPLFSG
jgi:hypothetical protein